MPKPPPVYQPCPAAEAVQARRMRVVPAPVPGQAAKPQYPKPLVPRVETHGAPPVYRPRISPIPVQLARWGASGWGAPGSQPAFLKNEKESPAVAFPPLSGSNPAPPLIPIQPPSKRDEWERLPEVKAKPKAEADPLAGIKRKIIKWSRAAHAGSKATLSEEQIATLEAWALAVPSKGGGDTAFLVERGKGTGAYSAKDQLKIISKNYASYGGKKPTYHITLS